MKCFAPGLGKLARPWPLALAVAAAFGCEAENAPPTGAGAMAGPAPAMMTFSVLIETGLSGPRDLAFNPRQPAQLWIINKNSDVNIVDNATDPGALKGQTRRDRNYLHFMPNPSSLAFGGDETNPAAVNPALVPGTFATCQESTNAGPDPRATGNNFMGPVLWSSDLSVFAVKNGELGSHLDMLHQSPLCMGIAWGNEGNVYWTFNGYNRSIDRYNFEKDHGIGNDDHSDGLIHRFAPDQLGYERGVPSHLVYRPEEEAVYLADTGKSRILKLTYEKAQRGPAIFPAQDEAQSFVMLDETLVELVPAGAGIVQKPSGLEIRKDELFVSDNATGDIVRLSLAGKLIARYPTGVAAGGLAGMAFGPDGRLYFVDMVGNRVLRSDAAF
jgi:hypothetical protein